MIANASALNFGLALLFLTGAHCQYNATDFLNFALNLECLEARFYSIAVYGQDLSAVDLGDAQPILGNKANLSEAALVYATAIAEDEIGHVRYLRRLLGPFAVPCPTVDINTSFSAVANAALGADLTPPFSPFNSDLEFYLSSFLFEDAGVTGYRGAIRALLELGEAESVDVAAGFLAVESYHAGVLRATLSTLADAVVEPYGLRVGDVTVAAAALINSLSMEPKTIGLSEEFVTTNGTSLVYSDTLSPGAVPTLVPLDEDFVVFSRNTSEILEVVYLGAQPGGFYPQGFTGTIATVSGPASA